MAPNFFNEANIPDYQTLGTSPKTGKPVMTGRGRFIPKGERDYGPCIEEHRACWPGILG